MHLTVLLKLQDGGLEQGSVAVGLRWNSHRGTVGTAGTGSTVEHMKAHPLSSLEQGRHRYTSTEGNPNEGFRVVYWADLHFS